ncbi:hypothetical protein [Thermostaphylospora chromogena]|uniref:Uncharacterized protein n=1 Tax=Thermostaphylospora chromogena TaxID=35622 RepID=A0A1H0ZXI9_9ACTN|nr:hypothetical protein [Thermostaphylospora chromogena]SDQ32123.1 hypothetical protein SAMN04489764_0200 [Thermostaphylospora chromogena]
MRADGNAITGNATTSEAVDHLQRLACQLEAHAFKVELRSCTGLFPRLHVINPMAPSRTEDVFAAHEQNGEWWFWLSWAGRIGHADDVATAAERIATVLHVTRR